MASRYMLYNLNFVYMIKVTQDFKLEILPLLCADGKGLHDRPSPWYPHCLDDRYKSCEEKQVL